MPVDALAGTLANRFAYEWDILSWGSQHLKVAHNDDYCSELRRFWASRAYSVHGDAQPHTAWMRRYRKTQTDRLKVVPPKHLIC